MRDVFIILLLLLLLPRSGQGSSVPKGTKVVLVAENKQRLDNNKSRWDLIVHRPAGNSLILQVSWEKNRVPST